MRIVWSSYAIKDINSIYEFYREKNKKTAVKFYNGIIQETEILSTHPNIAKVEPQNNDLEYTVRGLIVQKGLFKVIYFINERDEIYIARIRCCRQNPNDLVIDE